MSIFFDSLARSVYPTLFVIVIIWAMGIVVFVVVGMMILQIINDLIEKMIRAVRRRRK